MKDSTKERKKERQNESRRLFLVLNEGRETAMKID